MIHEFTFSDERKIFCLHYNGACYPFKTRETAMMIEDLMIDDFEIESLLSPDICPLEILECVRIIFQIAIWTMAEEAIQ